MALPTLERIQHGGELYLGTGLVVSGRPFHRNPTGAHVVRASAHLRRSTHLRDGLGMARHDAHGELYGESGKEADTEGNTRAC